MRNRLTIRNYIIKAYKYLRVDCNEWLFLNKPKHYAPTIFEELKGVKNDKHSKTNEQFEYDWSCCEDDYLDEQAYHPIGRRHGNCTDIWVRNWEGYCYNGRHFKRDA